MENKTEIEAVHPNHDEFMGVFVRFSFAGVAFFVLTMLAHYGF